MATDNLAAEIDALRAENQRLRADLEAVQRSVERYRAALVTYGDHKAGGACEIGGLMGMRCICGFTDALAPPEERASG